MDPLRQFFLFFLKNAQNDWDALAIISNCLETETGVRTQCHLNVFCIVALDTFLITDTFEKSLADPRGDREDPTSSG